MEMSADNNLGAEGVAALGPFVAQLLLLETIGLRGGYGCRSTVHLVPLLRLVNSS